MTRTSSTSRPATRSGEPSTAARRSSQDAETAAVEDAARATWTALGCQGFARADIMLPEGGEPQVLEVNVTPGLTETSLLPMACEAADIGFDQFVERALELALDRISASTA